MKLGPPKSTFRKVIYSISTPMYVLLQYIEVHVPTSPEEESTLKRLISGTRATHQGEPLTSFRFSLHTEEDIFRTDLISEIEIEADPPFSTNCSLCR